MNPDEFEDRYRALETLTVTLIRHMIGRGVLTTEQVRDLMVALTDDAAGDDRATWCAERLVRRVNGPRPRSTEAWDEDQVLAERRASIYGGTPIPVDL